ncbi:MAG: hypothetical protein RLP15_11610 [Cryomorphaceae bacterium]
MTADSTFNIDLNGAANDVFGHTLHQLFKYVSASGRNGVTIGLEGSGSAIEVSRPFCDCLQGEMPLNAIFTEGPEVRLNDGAVDHLSTVVYMVNYLQEYGRGEADEIGRFPFESSYQCKFGVVSENLVLKHFKLFLEQFQLGTWTDQPSRIFVSHDNDGLYRSFKQDGMYALSKGRLDWLLRIVFSEVMRKPRWFNMDRIMDINDAYDLKSTFFWLVEKGDVWVDQRKLRNADYAIDDPKILSQMERIRLRSFEQGIHKAIGPLSFRQELEKLPFACASNRNHFLRLRIPEHFTDIDEAGLKLDFSLGFAEEFGLRNNFALPYKPFDLRRMRPTEATYVPLMIMDTTNWTYKRLSLKSFKEESLSLIDQHASNAVISVLWHNKYFSDMKFAGYLEVYKAILDLCKQRNVTGITQKEMLSTYDT